MNRQARLMLAANCVTNIGNGIQTIAVGKLLFDQTGSIAAFGWVIVFQYAVTFLLQFVAGPWVDRGNPKRICVAVDGVRGAVICVVTLLITRQHPVLGALLVTLAVQVGRPFYRSALFALEPLLVAKQELTRYNGLSSTAIQTGQLAGMFLCGWVIRVQGAEAALFWNGASFLAASALVAGIGIGAAVRPEETTLADGALVRLRAIVDDWKKAMQVVRRDAVLAPLIMLGAADYVMVDMLNLAIVPLVSERFNGEPLWLSLLDGGFAVGAIIAGLFVDRVNQRLGLDRSIVVGVGVQALCFLLLTLGGHPYLTLVWIFGMGAANTVSLTVLVSALQGRLDRSMRGKIGSMRSLYIALTAGAAVPAVAHAGALSLRYGLLVSAMLGASFLVGALLVVRRDSFKAAAADLAGRPPIPSC
jgi:MFS transporter, DHA3 family, macrolide efflux protein